MDPEAFDLANSSISPYPLSQSNAVRLVEEWRKSKAQTLSPELYAGWVPKRQRFSHVNLNPTLGTPNKVLETMVGYSMTVRF
jgi:hypothetical protein